MIELTHGSIFIDDISLALLNRNAIRSALLTIPQDSCLLSGTIRFNADPSSSLPDTTIIAVLQLVGLWETISSRGGLDADIDTAPLSHGQQQLFSLARTILRKRKGGDRQRGVLVLDEVTASVDAVTEKKILGRLDEEFRGWTVVTVAHRLETLRGYDRVFVLDGGRVIDEGVPGELLIRLPEEE